MILHGIEYQPPTSLNTRIMADHVTYSFLAFMKSIFHFCLGCYCGGYSQNGRSNLSSYICHQFSTSTTSCQLILSSQYRFCHRDPWIMLKIVRSCVHIIEGPPEKGTYPLWIYLKSKLSPTKDYLDLLKDMEMWTNLPAIIPWCCDPIKTNNMAMCTKSSNNADLFNSNSW